MAAFLLQPTYIGQEYRIFFEDRTDCLALQKTARE